MLRTALDIVATRKSNSVNYLDLYFTFFISFYFVDTAANRSLICINGLRPPKPYGRLFANIIIQVKVVTKAFTNKLWDGKTV
jgi:hypothetical protein